MGIQKERDESGEGTLQLLRYWSFSFLSMWGHGCSHYRLCWFLPAAATKYHRLGGLKTNLFSHSSRGCKSKIREPAWLVPGKSSLSGSKTGAFLFYPLMSDRAWVSELVHSYSDVSSYKGTNPIIREPPSWPHLMLITFQCPTSKYHYIGG